MSRGRNTKVVVAALIARDGRVLITQRRADQHMPLQWEFPGGKVEIGETFAQALEREIREELGIVVRARSMWHQLRHAYPSFDLVMDVFPCDIVEGEPQAVEVAAFAWVPVHELPAWDILPADRPLVERLVSEGLP